MNYSKGISWIDDCRIPFVNDQDVKSATPGSLNCKGNDIFVGIKNDRAFLNTQGRFPANLLCSDDVLNDGVISKSSGNVINNTKPQTIYGNGKGIPRMKHENIPCDQGTNSRYYDIDKWFDKIIHELL